MVFPLGNHDSGVKNEKQIVEFQNKNANNELNVYFMEKNKTSNKCLWLHKGGTQMKQDAEVEVELENGEKTIEQISIKNHKSGTFDWENTTKLVPDFIKEKVNDFKKKHHGEEVTKELRGELEEIFSAGLDTITSEMIIEMLENIYRVYPKNILINNNGKKELLMFEKENLKRFFDPDVKPRYFLKKTRAKTSRQIWVEELDGEIVNTNLRIRMLTNNGITALLGRSEHNKTSVPSIKIQQDGVDKFIEGCKDKVRTNY